MCGLNVCPNSNCVGCGRAALSEERDVGVCGVIDSDEDVIDRRELLLQWCNNDDDEVDMPPRSR
jgi:hypothetical protein